MSLVAEEGRLDCDQCGGSLIARGDLAAAMAQIVMRTVELRFFAEKASDRLCPRCAQPLTKCRLQVVAVAKLREDLLRCETDGVWFPGETLAKLYALVGRRVLGIGREGGRSDEGSGGGGGGSGAADRVGLFRRHRAEGEVTPFVSLYRDRRLACPVCPEQALRLDGERWACDLCAGLFVESAALEMMMSSMTYEPWRFPEAASPEAPGARACPVCAERMRESALEPMRVDRCVAHGVWFDLGELAGALAAAAGAEKSRKSWIRRLFSRNG